ncbi:hypothetical protein BDV12DRAFT_165739 [Aspergillus spectabilis]
MEATNPTNLDYTDVTWHMFHCFWFCCQLLYHASFNLPWIRYHYRQRVSRSTQIKVGERRSQRH